MQRLQVASGRLLDILICREKNGPWIDHRLIDEDAHEDSLGYVR
jgi:hypothetical protein